MNRTLEMMARLLLATIFIVSGLRKIATFSTVAPVMAAKGIPEAEIALVLTIILELGGALMLVFGWYARWAAAALAAFTLAAGILFHDFWSLLAADEARFTNQFNHFLKNLAIVGGLLHVTAHPPRRPGD